ncbi:putative duf602 domain-containing protein [Botrytis fragariae]|uniref:Putative duf602 domain-containing protein n=1 Tax=Botrytis fragariae TaxID=1964551 RepID=A0A8H6EMN1_9HELO|nr:putative duf602 domain-containing protein [Botrytis fragariae]KAF5877847.1 putative duf602 domain-containing protein [Botrytis fragariae]
MGNDGGSIPTRRELVKEAARNPNTSELKATLHESQTHAWTYCPLSNKPLTRPIVSDCAGTLYNKDAILEQLLPKDDDVPASVIKEKEEILQGRVKGLRDIVEVKFSTVKEDKEEKKICPITSKELGAGTRAVYLVPCGHAFSEVAIKELKSDTCVECNEGYTAENVISILPISKEDISRLAMRASKLKEGGLTHSLKKAPGGKKKRKHATETESAVPLENGKENSLHRNQSRAKENGVADKAQARIQENGNGPATTRLNNRPSAVPSGIKNASAANLTAKVLEEQEERNKRRKLGMNDNLKSLFSNTGYNAQEQKGGDFMTRGFSMNKKT